MYETSLVFFVYTLIIDLITHYIVSCTPDKITLYQAANIASQIQMTLNMEST